ncbi:MAG: GAF domain-containing protein, partial [Candidatus Sulfotelmatobacter sp.]
MAWLDGHTRNEERSLPTFVMTTTLTKSAIEAGAGSADTRLPSWPLQSSAGQNAPYEGAHHVREAQPSGRDALQALLAFSALHQQVRQRRALAARHKGFEAVARAIEFEAGEQFVLDEVLQLVAERAIAITGADGLGIALAENNEIVLRASAGTIKPDVGARIQRDSAFSGACFRTAQIIRCDDTETDDRVNLAACRQLGARSMVAVPLCGRRRVIGLLEAFSAEPFGFNDSDLSSLELLAELILGALKPEDEDRFAESAQVAEAELAAPATPTATVTPVEKASSEPIAALVVPLPQVETKPEVTELTLDIATPAGSEPVLAVSAAEVSAEPERVPEETLALETESEPEPIAAHHPGIILILVLVVVCALLGGGLWWKLKNAQLGEMVIRPEEKIEKPVAKQPAQTATSPLAQSSTAPSIAGQNAPANSTADSASTDEDTAEPAAGSATPQEAGKLARITGIRHWSSADSSTVVLDLEDQVQYEAHRLAHPDRIYFDLHDTSLSPEFTGKTIEVGDALLARVRVAQPVAGLTRVVLETRGNSDFSVSLEPNPYRLVVQVRRLGANPKPQAKLFPGDSGAERGKLAIVIPPPTHEDLQLRARVPKMRIVVDAGHGGWDLGTVGRRGLLEKDLVLEIAQRLGKLLESRLGADVILTRNDDNYIPLDE